MRVPLILGIVLLSGCTLIPDLDRPAAPVPASFPQGVAYGDAPPGDTGLDNLHWEGFFQDAGLRRLIGLALANNRDLRVAALNVQTAETQYRAQRGELFPAVGAVGTANYRGQPIVGADGNYRTLSTRSFSLGGSFTSWELDLFGRIRSLSEAAAETVFAQAELRRATQISLVAQVADGYLALLTQQELLKLTRQTLESQEASLRLTQATAAGGTATALTLRQAQTSVETARANLSLYTRGVAQAENALALLLGQPVPRDLPAGTTLESPLVLGDLPVGLSSSVLLRRPDVVAAERTLRAANANIGAARAAFFPTITLTGTGGTSAFALTSLFSGGTGAWSFAPQISVPIFTGGINEANLDYARLVTRIEVANYERAIQSAFREVADTLAARGTYGSQLEAQRRLVEALADSYRLSELRFRSGVDNYLTTLDSQRNLYAAQQAQIALRQEQLSSLVALYRVMGGGWQEAR